MSDDIETKGIEKTLILLQCPHCNTEERYCPEDGEQPESFGFVEVEEEHEATIHYWVCRKCGKTFYTVLE